MLFRSIDYEETDNWPGNTGIWVPFEYDGVNGLQEGWYAGRTVPDRRTGVGTFLNNRNYEVLVFSDGSSVIPIPAYPYSKAPFSVSISPLSVDEEQSDVPVTVKWDAVEDAVSYAVTIHCGDKTVERIVTGTSFRFLPKSLFALDSLHGLSFYAEVRAVDQNGVRSLNSTRSLDMSYAGHIPPNPPKAVSLTPVAVDVAADSALSCSWFAPSPAGNAPEATEAAGYDVMVVSDGFSCESRVSGTSFTFKPSAIGLAVGAGITVSVKVRSVDRYGYVSEWVESNGAKFTEAASYAADSFYLVGAKGTRNEVLFTGEECMVVLNGEVDGSFPIAVRRLVSLSGGFSAEIGTDGLVKIKGVLKPATTALMRVESYDSKGNPVYNRNGEWPVASILFYGGLVYVYDDGWKLGWLYVYDGGWKEAMTANIYDGGWR